MTVATLGKVRWRSPCWRIRYRAALGPESRTADVVEEVGGVARRREYPKFPDKKQKKLLRQLRFAKENGLNGVRWETNSIEVYEDVMRYAKNVLDVAELKRFSIVLLGR